jgi:hypothetical protein
MRFTGTLGLSSWSKCHAMASLQIRDGLLLRIGDDVIRNEAALNVDRELAERALLELGREVFGLNEIANVPH